MRRKAVVLFGAGAEGIKAFHYMGKDKVCYFIDNDQKKQGRTVLGVPVYGPEQLIGETNRELVITVSGIYEKEIKQQLDAMGIHRYKTIREVIHKDGFQSDERIKKLKNRFQGKRCFIIGTGPSLRLSDLEKLDQYHEISFASNKIFKLFHDTKWRPQLYCISDREVFSFYYDEICNLKLDYQFFVHMADSKYQDLDFKRMEGEHNYTFRIFKEEIYDEQMGMQMPGFSEEPDRYVVDGGITVTYSMLQWACFLGFKEIYLLGVDFSYGDRSGQDQSQRDHFCKNYIEKGEIVNYPRLEESLKAYQTAEKFSRAHGFRIYNATRGGKLEVFERVDFDSLFG